MSAGGALGRLEQRALWLVAATLAARRDPPPLRTGPAYAHNVTSVVRPPAQLATAIVAATAPLRRRFAEHHWYEAGSLHLTVLNLDELLVAGLEPPAIARLVEPVVAGTPAFGVRLHGLGLSGSTVLLEASVDGPALGALRRDLRRLRRLAAPSGAGNAGDARKRHLAFMNVARLRARASGALVAELRRQRHRDHGGFETRAVELLRTDIACTPAATTLLARYPLQ